MLVMKSADSLRKKHHTFTYQAFKYNLEGKNLKISFSFLLHPDINFKPELVIQNVAEQIRTLEKPLLDNLVFHLGLIELFSYWKSTCAPKIRIEAGGLNKDQIKWWKNLILNGMGEFFYQNKINFTKDNFISIINKDKNSINSKSIKVNNGYLTLVGGGKDSIVSIELLKKLKINQSTLSLNPTTASNLIIKIAEINKSIIVNRKIDQKLLKLNLKGYLNGHTPFSAHLAFLSLLIAALFNHQNIIVSNERSSDEENIIYLNKKINHQYSKSLEFEKSFRKYISKFITPSINYFSLVRPLWEIQISKIFTQYPDYFQVFKSCNKSQKQNQWCCQCPKCLSVFILLFPFLKQKTVNIFGKNLYQDLNLAPTLEQLSGLKQPKPFECVGTKEEIIIGLYLSLKQYKDKLPKLLKFSQEKILNQEKNLEKRAKTLLQSWGYDQFLTSQQKQVLKELTYA